jgi:hypothetical protein
MLDGLPRSGVDFGDWDTLPFFSSFPAGFTKEGVYSGFKARVVCFYRLFFCLGYLCGFWSQGKLLFYPFFLPPFWSAMFLPSSFIFMAYLLCSMSGWEIGARTGGRRMDG